VRVGSTAEFEFQGRRLVGRVNRIGRRATVLVEDVLLRPGYFDLAAGERDEQ